eukprot:TRINITY_DN1929_c0_g1_i1.p1 TRINITY_DN1929_c0_g1~~TRINITY_DN1929_c0_g1_i1.p1  ORF type:complete len:362 (+),score=62.17 TRINITY_DN1929_c0_g1_i1:93-1178(+)
MVSIKLCFLFLALVHVSVVYSDDTTVLFIGNSYTNANNLGNLIQQVFSGENQVTSGVRAVDGQTLNRHYAESESSATSPLLYQALWNTSSTPWDFAVLQEQSLTPGLLNEPLYEDQFNDFFNAVSKFKEQFTNRGTTTILFETWGRRDGYTESNPPVGDIYPTYSAMQSLISEGIGLASESFDIPVAKVGRAFNYLYLNNNALFRQLYIADGSHPSIFGSYLSAAVIFNTIKGAPAAQFAKTFAGVNTSTACYLARVADLVTFNLDGMPSDETCAVAPVIKTTIITPTSKFTYKGKCGGNIGAAQTREHDYFSTGLTPAATRLKLTPENGTFFMKFFFGFHLNLEEVEKLHKYPSGRYFQW